MLVIYVVLLLPYLSVGDGAKITILHMFGGSHYMSAKVIGDELSKRGHEVSICVPARTKDVKSNTAKIIKYDPGFAEEDITRLSRNIMESRQQGPLQLLKAMKGLAVKLNVMCHYLLDNKNTMDEIRDSDLLVIEVMMFCGPQIAQIYNKPFIIFIPGPILFLPSYIYRVPVNPSYIPFSASTFPFNMTFGQRLINYAMHKVFSWVLPAALNWVFSDVKEKLGLPLSTDILESMSQAKILLGSCDFALDSPHPLMPNTFCVGPIQVKPSEPLPEELEQFVNTTHGFILVAFGTVFNMLTREQVRRMNEAFGQLKENVIWQLQDSYNISLSSNIRAMKWVPQNDLLGHPKMKLFISHMGGNSFQQAVYHGVPLLGAPRGGDQWQTSYHAKVRLQIGEYVDIDIVTTEEWFEKIRLVIDSESYRIEAKKRSRYIKTKKESPMKITGDLIEYVIDNNYDVSHLRSHALDLNWYIHEMWDIYTLFLVVFYICLVFSYYVVKWCVSLILCRKQKQE